MWPPNEQTAVNKEGSVAPHKTLVLHVPVDDLLLPFLLTQRMLLENPAQNKHRLFCHWWIINTEPLCDTYSQTSLSGYSLSGKPA